MLCRHSASSRSGRGSKARGLTLAETAVSTLIVGVTLVAALNTVGAARGTELAVAERGRAVLLAQDLLAEVLQQAYEDPDLGPGSFGLGSDEVGDGSRLLWEDVDDYDGWSAAPPQTREGNEIAWAQDYRRTVEVCWVQSADLTAASLAATGIKRIRVTVAHRGRDLVTLTAYRTEAWPAASGLWEVGEAEEPLPQAELGGGNG